MADTKFKRSALTLGALIAVLTAAYVLGLVFSPARVEKRRAAEPLVARLVAIAESVAQIRVSGPEGTVELARKDGSWVIALGGRDYPASASRVEVLLDFLGEVKRLRVAAENPELWKDFGVGADAPKRLELRDEAGAALVELVIGNPEMSLSGDYVRAEGSNEVLLSDRSFAYYTGTDPRFWSELRIFPEGLKGVDIVRFSVDAQPLFGDAGAEAGVKGARYTLRIGDQKPAAWVVEGQAAAALDAGEIEKLLNAVAGMEGNEFAVGMSAAEAGLAQPRGRIVISANDGSELRLLIGAAAEEKQHYVGLEGGDIVYRVAEWRLQEVVKDLQELAPKPAGQQ